MIKIKLDLSKVLRKIEGGRTLNNERKVTPWITTESSIRKNQLLVLSAFCMRNL